MANIAQSLISDWERISVADPERVHTLPAILNVSLRPNYFNFMEYLR